MKTDRVVLPLVLLQAVSVVTLWSLDSLDKVGQETFTLFLAVDLIAFAIMAHVYRTTREGEGLGRRSALAGSLVILLILLTTLFLS